MNINTELLKKYVADLITNQITIPEFEAFDIIESSAAKILSEIQEIIKTIEYDDFQAVEEIICLLERNNLDCGGRHDF
ncbi:MAG: hypothetical protein IJC74_04625 [Clostridia bacterium]|nr:hypothetical protein [Clostridia bacterium]